MAVNPRRRMLPDSAGSRLVPGVKQLESFRSYSVNMSTPLNRLDDLISVLKGERDERRSNARIKTLRRTRIVREDEGKGMRCFICDISKTGARLRPADAEAVPDRFLLQVEHDLSLVCDVKYRSQDEVGVSFDLTAQQ